MEEDDNGEKVVSVSIRSSLNQQLMVPSNRVFHGRTKVAVGVGSGSEFVGSERDEDENKN